MRWSRRPIWRTALPAVAVLVAASSALGGCTTTSSTSGSASTSKNEPRAAVISFSSGPGLTGELFPPARGAARTAPLVVLVPGGGWHAVDPTGLVPLARTLAAAGMAAATTTYRVAPTRFPEPVADVVCAVDTAAARLRAAGIRPSPIVVLGHSAGAQLAALDALAGARFRGACSAPPASVDALIGLAGPYDIGRFADVAEALLGTAPSADPVRWREANPLTWAADRPSLPALLAYGTKDTLVAPSFAFEFAQALRAAGHPVRVVAVDGATHGSIYRPAAIAATVIGWIRNVTHQPK